MENDEQQILKLFEDGDRALIAADVAELSRIFADDYIQYDESGNASYEARPAEQSQGRQDPLPLDDLHRPSNPPAE